MNFNKKWLYVVVLSAILVPLIIIFVLSVTDPTKKKEEVKINNASYTTADGRVTVTAKEDFKQKKVSNYDLYLTKQSLSKGTNNTRLFSSPGNTSTNLLILNGAIKFDETSCSLSKQNSVKTYFLSGYT